MTGKRSFFVRFLKKQHFFCHKPHCFAYLKQKQNNKMRYMI